MKNCLINWHVFLNKIYVPRSSTLHKDCVWMCVCVCVCVCVWSDFSWIHVIPSFLVIFRDFQMYVTSCQIGRFFRFLSQIKALFFYFNLLFLEYFLSPLRVCYWLIITDYFSSIFPMLNSHKKNGFFPKTVSQTRFRLFNFFLV